MAARGEHVVLMSAQGKDGIDKYTHRIGRTGRAGKEGRAVSFWTDGDAVCGSTD